MKKTLSSKFYQQPTSKNRAFTLVELIVVIVILAILWTIAFISFQWYSRNSRDSVRIADINSAKKSLEIFITKAWFYPTPDNGVNITYSWAIVWTEGTLWTNVIKNIESVSKVITDPLTATEYTYSITSSKTEYQIWWISEWWWLTGNIPTNNTYATDLSKSSAVAYISWNYNEKFTKVNTWTTSWILAQPSIISTDKTTSTDLANILSNKKLSYNNYSNYPSSYNTPWAQSGWFNYTNWNPIIFTWTLEELHDDNQRKLDFLTNLKQAYTSTDLATNPMYEDIMSIDTINDSTWAINLVISYINSNKWGIKLQQLALLQANWTTWENSSPLITLTDCTNAWWVWVDNTIDMYIWTTKWDWFCISPRVGDFWDSTWNWISFNGWWNFVDWDYKWWDLSSIDDTGNWNLQYWQTKKLDSNLWYSCKSLWTSSTDSDTSDTILWRMKWLVTNKANLTQLQDIEWVQNAIPPNWHPIPALYIADCIDGVKDLWTTMTYIHNNNTTDEVTYAEYNTDVTVNTDTVYLSDITYQNRQKYLIAWTQKTGSHLPSAMSYISSWYASASDIDWVNLTWEDRWEYQLACEAWLFWIYSSINQSSTNDQEAQERIWLSAIGTTSGTDWGRRARLSGSTSCGAQVFHNTGSRYGILSARFVIRP